MAVEPTNSLAQETEKRAEGKHIICLVFQESSCHQKGTSVGDKTVSSDRPTWCLSRVAIENEVEFNRNHADKLHSVSAEKH